MNLIDCARNAKKASIQLTKVETERKNNYLTELCNALKQNHSTIINANVQDIARSEKEKIPLPLLKRLKFDETKIAETISGLESLAKLPDPVGKIQYAIELDEDLTLYRVSCPIGVIGIIFESRPDALIQISSLCLKSSNAVLLKGGSEARETNRILTDIIINVSEKCNIPHGWIHLLETRQDVTEMLQLDDYIDLIIPRGSNEFVQFIMNNTRIPVLGHADGICHLFVDEEADLNMAVALAVDSKTQYVAVCNALETLLVHKNIAETFLPMLKKKMDEKKVQLIGCEQTQKIIPVTPATERDWRTEYLDYKLSIKIVDSLQEAIDHINEFGSGHTDAIVTNNRNTATRFMEMVDSANVFWNASTRFSDGYRYGLGAEVGISTNKIHARGPVGLEGLVSYKYKLYGNGHTVEEYASGKRKFTHRRIQ
ncbi:MAG: glutamate-5-semialdehyde dehydrogenase [Spirochaetes bacterium]|nr:glutamate-5-semialdehyde dehydrogenase [Spirochaetota bacterium]